MTTTEYNLAYFVSHPIQYQAPLLKELSAQKEINLSVFFLSGASTKAYHDPGFSNVVKWDIPLTDGYKHQFLNSSETNQHYSMLNPKVSLSSVKDALGQQHWDAIWIHGYNNIALLYVIHHSIRKRIPLLFRGESNLTSTSQSFFKNKFIRYLIKKTHGLLWVSSDNKDYYRHFGAQDHQLFFTPYAVDNDRFQSAKVALSRTATKDKCIILYASKFIPRKHAPLLVQAYAELAPEIRKRSELWLVGDGSDREKVETIISREGIEEQVKLFGFKNQTELPQYMAACDVFVLPSEREPFGLVINEVMNFGKAIITTNEVGAARDLVVDGDNGWVLPAKNIEVLKAAMQNAINDPNRVSKMGHQSFKRIKEWSFQQDIQGILSALRETGGNSS